MHSNLNDLIEARSALKARIVAHLDDVEARNTANEPSAKRTYDAMADQLADLDAQIDAANDLARRNASADEIRSQFTPKPAGRALDADPVVDVALRSLDGAHKRGELHDAGATYVDGLLRNGPTSARRSSAEWVAAAGDPAYMRAFGKILADPQRGHLNWTTDERAAFNAVSGLESRAALGTSGYVLPVSVDPVVMLTNDGAISGIADAARKVNVPFGDSWKGMTSAGATHEWKTENAEAADGTPSVSEVDVPLFSSVVNATWSYELGDAFGPEVVGELRRVVTDAVSVAWASAFATGGGSTDPAGLITGLAAASGSKVTGGGTEAIDADDPFLLQNALPARFSRDARWLGHISVMNAFRARETSNGAILYPELRELPPSLLGKLFAEESSIAAAGDLNPGADGDWYGLVYGDIARAFVIATQPGSRMEVLPAYGGNGRPTAASNLLVYSRVGSKVVNPAAARVLHIATAA